ncbi:hypothetical protein ASPWEDRAFT_175623 [Aspergillus wentii DTO 134E9]|uniref:Uncharacterized protein n=1 Tax=Aspergillus wentii DTO 134E9 TaxID=1073089 RepID=A0A1L9RBP7_ASPWE|nr:uncharacterized protein ASPWEDRAFT_175623 [Aspergillus wentii DTO 134E9]KAI9934901.1 hypothetical protein MW887_000522 [Aspergillus wentii]OJJ32342.1 hypothetical protein ASPWEDRAFT_175623 [Aspergillus wentii DTO 134E9]
MQDRANQRKVDEDGGALDPETFEYENERRFPVLMLSFLGPQHGRIFYACMDDEALVIRQSKLYSFEKGDSPPWDFFTRILRSSPEEESLSIHRYARAPV